MNDVTGDVEGDFFKLTLTTCNEGMSCKQQVLHPRGVEHVHA